MASKWKVGDVVQLASGGPSMTVIECRDGDIVCQWFDAKKQLQNGTFPEDSVQKPSPMLGGILVRR